MYSSQWVRVTNFPSAHHLFSEKREMDVQRAFAVQTYTSLLLNFLTDWNRPLASHCCWRKQMTSQQMTSVLLSNGDRSNKQSLPLMCSFALTRYWKGQLLVQGDGVDWEKVSVSIMYLWMWDPSRCLAAQNSRILHLNAIHLVSQVAAQPNPKSTVGKHQDLI